MLQWTRAFSIQHDVFQKVIISSLNFILNYFNFWYQIPAEQLANGTDQLNELTAKIKIVGQERDGLLLLARIAFDQVFNSFFIVPLAVLIIAAGSKAEDLHRPL